MTTDKSVLFTLDDVLRSLGHYGKYQILSMGLLLTVALFTGLAANDFLFIAGDVPFRCHVPECEESSNSSYQQEWTSFTMESNNHCKRYKPLTNIVPSNNEDNLCTAENFNQSELIPCEEYVYGSEKTMLYEFGFHCDMTKLAMIGTVENIAYFLVLPLSGVLSDKYGRKSTLLVTSISRTIFGILKSFSTSYPMFLSFAFLGSFFGSATVATGILMVSELFASEKRTLMSLFFMMCFSLGESTEGLVAWSFPYWRTFIRVVYLPQLMTVIYIFLLDNSARWLLSRGKSEEAIRVLNKAAKMNNKELPAGSLESLSSPQASENITKNISDNPFVLIKRVLKSPTMRVRFFIIPIWWMTAILVFYGLMMNSVGLGGSKYFNFSLVALMELPGEIIGFIAMDKIGRKRTIFLAYFFCAVANISFTLIPADYFSMKLMVYLFGKICVMICVIAIYTYTVELYPTQVRHSLFALSSTIGRVGSILAPQTPLLATIWPPFPMVLFGSMALLSAVLVIPMPETMGMKLPDTIEEAEQMSHAKDTKI